MVLFIQALPLLALVVLLGTGRASAPVACGVALVMTVPAAVLAVPAGAEAGAWLWLYGLSSASQGLWLALIPVGIVLGGLVFHDSVRPRGEQAPSDANAVDTLFTGAFLLGGFTETVTGFGVGTVFALSAFRRVGVTGQAAAAIAIFSQLLIPWAGDVGGRRPGRAGAAGSGGAQCADIGG